MYTAFADPNMKAQVGFCGKADHLQYQMQAMIEQGTALTLGFGFGQTEGRSYDPRHDWFSSHLSDYSSSFSRYLVNLLAVWV